MAEKGDYHISEVYQGGYSSLDSEYGNAYGNYRVSAGSLGLTTDPRTANILQEASSKLSTGVKQIEVSAIQPEIFESIPKQHLKEVNRLSKLTGVDISVHGPLIEPSGMTQQGFNEIGRIEAERQLNSAIEKSHELNPKGNIPVTFHSSVSVPGPTFEKTKEGEEIFTLPIINQETGQVTAVKKEVKHYPGMTEEKLRQGEIQNVQEQLNTMNNTQWLNDLTPLLASKERTDRILNETQPLVEPVLDKIIKEEISIQDLPHTQQQSFYRYYDALHELRDMQAHLNSLFNRAYKYGTDEEKKALEKVSKNFSENLPKNPYDGASQLKAMQRLINQLYKFSPEQFKPAEEFTMDKTATTFANVAYNSYKKFRDSAPIISVENPPVGTGFSRGEDLKKIVETAREKFIDNAVSKGMSRSKARQQAEKLIGVTWDIGHINMLRKYGYEAKDIIKETEKVAPLVKHVHLSDNFGFEHTELPMGMGNVPLKEIMEKLGKKGFEAKKIIEAANWWQHFKDPPVKETFEAVGSPIYSMKMAPYWNQSLGFQQGYFTGYGRMLPQINYETFSSGFSQLPAELGGERGGQGGRMSGKPME